MKLSAKGRYAVMAMVDIAMNMRDNEYVSLQSIAQRGGISVVYLEQLFIKLRKKGLVSSAKGPKGGYRLVKDTKDISVSEVITAVDEKIEFLRCKQGVIGCINGKKCNSHDLWTGLMADIYEYLQNTSLAQVIDNERIKRKQA